MKVDRIRRRTFLRGAGAVTLTLPFLGSLGGRVSAADPPAAQIRRAIFFYVPYGTIQEQWFPLEAARTSTVRVSPRAVETRTSDVAGDFSPVFSRASMGDVIDKMLMLDGIDGPYSIGHEKTYPLTGYVRGEASTLPGMSIDQLIANRARIYPTEPAFRSLNLASGAGNHHGSSMSFTLNGDRVVPVPQISDAAAFWDYAFERVLSGSADAPMEFDRLRTQKLSVIDHVFEDYERLMAHPNLSSTDRARVDAYLTYLRQYEQSVQASTLIECAAPPRPDVAGYERGSRDYVPMGHDQVANILGAVRCGLTNVVTFNVEPSARGYALPGISGDHHGLSHGKDGSLEGSAVSSLLEIDRHHARLLTELVRGLDVEEDPGSGRTFLDNSVLLVCSDMGSVANHKGQRMPCILFGGRDYLKTGRIVDFRTPYTRAYGGVPRQAGVGISYNNVLVTVCRALGLTPEDYEQGQTGIGDYQPSRYFTQLFPGGQEEYEALAYGDRQSALAEIVER